MGVQERVVLSKEEGYQQLGECLDEQLNTLIDNRSLEEVPNLRRIIHKRFFDLLETRGELTNNVFLNIYFTESDISWPGRFQAAAKSYEFWLVLFPEYLEEHTVHKVETFKGRLRGVYEKLAELDTFYSRKVSSLHASPYFALVAEVDSVISAYQNTHLEFSNVLLESSNDETPNLRLV